MAIRIVYLALSMSASTRAGFAQALPFDPTLLRDATQDGTGRAWAIGRERGLYFWQDGKWREQELALPDRAPPLLLQTNHQGEIFVLWGGYQEVESPHWITRLRGSRPPVSASWRACIPGASMSFQRQARSISPRVVDVWKTQGNLQRDQRRHLWTLWSQPTVDASLGEWDGAQWKTGTWLRLAILSLDGLESLFSRPTASWP